MSDLLSLFSVPVAHAESVESFVSNVDKFIINPLIVFLFAVALAVFVFGVLEFLANGENEEKKTAGKSHMMWGIIGLTVMMGVWTILGIILQTLNINYIDPKQGSVNIPHYTPPSNQ